MKQIIALQQYTDKFISLYQGEIRNIQNTLADKLIEEGIVAEHSDDETPCDGGTIYLELTNIPNAPDSILPKTWQEIYNYIQNGKLIVFYYRQQRTYEKTQINQIYYLYISGVNYYLNEEDSTKNNYEIFIYNFAYANSLEYRASSPNDYPVYYSGDVHN